MLPKAHVGFAQKRCQFNYVYGKPGMGEIINLYVGQKEFLCP